MKTIPLTQGLFAVVSDKDFGKLSRHEWFAHWAGNSCYAERKESGKLIKMHCQILGRKGVDHRDGDGLNNARSNLRPASKSNNMANSRARLGKFKGVDFRKHVGKWRARITYHRKVFELGLFSTAKDAARAYDDMARACFGSFARTNFPV